MDAKEIREKAYVLCVARGWEPGGVARILKQFEAEISAEDLAKVILDVVEVEELYPWVGERHG